MKIHRTWGEGTKKRLIEAAGEIFAKKGFRKATIREICERANAGVSAVNYHFHDKEGLYEAVFDYSYHRAVEKYPHDLGLEMDNGPEERLKAFIRAFLLRGLGDGFPTWHAKLLAQETANPSGILSKLAQTVIRGMDEYLEDIIRKILIRDGSPREPDVHLIQQCRMNIIGQCIFQMHVRQFAKSTSHKPLEPRQIAAIADQICTFSMGGILASAAGGRA